MAQRHFLVPVVLTTFALTAVSYGQRAKSSQTEQIVKWDNYVFKFLPGGQMAQVLNSDGKVIGTILQMNGELQAIPLPGPEADKLKKSFEDWKTYNARSHSNDSPKPVTTSAETASPSAPVNGNGPSASTTSFDEASKTVTLASGGSVTFTDDDNVKASVPNASGAGFTIYDLHYHSGSAGGFLKGTVVNGRNTGASLGGSGVTISTGGTKFFDTADGGRTPSIFVRARQIAGPVIEASKVAGSSVSSSHVVKSLKSSNMNLDKK